MCRRVKFVSISGVIAAVVESMTSSVTCLCALAVFDLANIACVFFFISYPILFVASLPITLSCFCCPFLLYFLLFQFLLALFISRLPPFLSLFSFPFFFYLSGLVSVRLGCTQYRETTCRQTPEECGNQLSVNSFSLWPRPSQGDGPGVSDLECRQNSPESYWHWSKQIVHLCACQGIRVINLSELTTLAVLSMLSCVLSPSMGLSPSCRLSAMYSQHSGADTSCCWLT